jgi:hypothetical protein
LQVVMDPALVQSVTRTLESDVKTYPDARSDIYVIRVHANTNSRHAIDEDPERHDRYVKVLLL